MTLYPGDAVTWLSNDIDPNTPAGFCKALRRGAEICLTGAKTLDASSSGWDLPDRQILAFHALELALKAFLAKHGLTRETLRNKPYGHDLDRLYSDAIQRGLSPPPRSKELIAAVNEYHNTHIIPYEFATTRTVPTCATLFPIVEAILAACSGC
jgi:HEPN domain-containing protein